MRPAALLIAAVTALAVVLVAAWAKRRGVGWPGLAAGAAVCFAGAVVCLSGGCGSAGGGAGVALGGKEAPPEGLERFHGELLTPDEIAAILKVGTARLPAAALPTTADQLPRLPYRPAPYRARTSLHLGQRKLLLSEVDFLTARARPGDTVVYAGAAPGIHTGFLAALFPAARFELYDPRPFALRGSAEQLGRIRAHQKYFTDDDAAAYAGRDDVLFVCDIRTATPGAADTEERVAADMAAQARWVDIMQPRAAMLKYRPPYSSDAPFEYLAGEVRLQAWGPRSSSEGRLVAERPYQTVPQEAREYEDRMFYLSSVVREWAAYDHGIPVRLVERSPKVTAHTTLDHGGEQRTIRCGAGPGRRRPRRRTAGSVPARSRCRRHPARARRRAGLPCRGRSGSRTARRRGCSRRGTARA